MIRPEAGLEFLPGLTLVRRLGRGGMGEAWLARDAERGCEVVAKIVPPEEGGARAALLRREARLVRKLDHPGIVPVYGFRTGEHGSAITSRYMPGGDAGKLRGGPPLPIVRAARQVAEALEHLHSLGVVHRDVKAQNVLLDASGRAGLADFGIAAAGALDEEGLVVRGGGSRASISPQQRRGDPAHPQDDLYALGALIYELLSGRPPFSPSASDDEILTSTPPPVASSHPLPEELRGLVASLLSPLPTGRPASMSVAREALARIEEGLLPPGRVQPEPRLQPPPRPGSATLSPTPSGPQLLSPRPPPASLPLREVGLALLAAGALFVAFVLPRWVRPPAAPALRPSSPETSSPTPAAVGASPIPPPPPLPAELPAATPTPEAQAARDAEQVPRAPSEARPRPDSSPRPRPPVDTAGERAFAAAVSEGEAALARNDFPSAEAAFTRAEGLEAGTDAVASGLARTREGQRVQALARLRDHASALETAEDWKGALGEYRRALALEPTVAFALEGSDRAAARADLASRLDFHLRHPGRLTTNAVAAEAEALLVRARNVPSPGPRLVAQIAGLEKALADARATVEVVIESDGATDLVMSGVGRLGPLTRRTLELRPGSYTVVGSRRGYRDVRRQFTVVPGADPPVVDVRCQEAI
jgi:serine/threonine protein kinase